MKNETKRNYGIHSDIDKIATRLSKKLYEKIVVINKKKKDERIEEKQKTKNVFNLVM